MLDRYDEGIDLLYRTNTFHLSGEHLLTRLPDYILPRRLAQMASFELVFPLSGSLDNTPFQPSSATLLPLLNTLAQSSGVKRLFLSLPCPQLQGVVADVDLTHVLDAVDAFVRTTETESTVLQMNPTALKGLATDACTFKDEESTEPRQRGCTYQLWRCLDGDAGQARIDKRVCFYPQVLAPLQDPASPELRESRGYWIMESSEEANFRFVCNMP